MNHIVATGIQPRGRPSCRNVNQGRVKSLTDHNTRCMTPGSEILRLRFNSPFFGRCGVLAFGAFSVLLYRRVVLNPAPPGSFFKSSSEPNQSSKHITSYDFN